MGINTIVKGIIALFLIGIIYLSITPLVVDLANDPVLFSDEMDPNTLLLKENALLIFYTSGLLTFFVIIIWMFNASSASGAQSSYDY